MISVLARDGRTVEFTHDDGQWLAAFYLADEVEADLIVESDAEGRPLYTVVDLVLATSGEIDWTRYSSTIAKLQRSPELDRLASVDDPRRSLLDLLRHSLAA